MSALHSSTSRESNRPPSARLIVFPLNKRRRFIARQAELAAAMSASACERHILRTCQVQADYLRRKGVDDREIAAEIRSLNAALRAAIWEIVLLGDCRA